MVAGVFCELTLVLVVLLELLREDVVCKSGWELVTAPIVLAEDVCAELRPHPASINIDITAQPIDSTINRFSPRLFILKLLIYFNPKLDLAYH